MRLFELEYGQKKGINILKNKNIDPEDINDAKLSRIASVIQTRCSDVISDYKAVGKILYRGLRNMPEDQWIFKGRQRQQRNTYSDDEVADLANSAFEQAGFKATRTNSIACSSDKSLTEYFGDAFCIFPINGFAFTWSGQIKDFGDSFAEGIQSKYYDYPLEFIHDYQFTDQNFSLALQSGHEININGEYYALMIDSYIGRELTKKVMGVNNAY